MSDEKKPGPRPTRESEHKKGDRSSNVRLNQDEPRRRPDTVNKGQDSPKGGKD